MNIIVTSIISFIFAFFSTSSFNKNILSQNIQKSEAKKVQMSITPAPLVSEQILGETTTNVDTITFDVDAVFNKPLTINNGVTFDGASIFSKTIKGVSIDIGRGALTAGNVLYSIKPGSGIGISTDDAQNPTISNTGVLSVQGQTGVVSLSLSAGGGISVDGLKVTNSDTGSSQKIFKTIKGWLLFF